jgi:hypothetical protein
MRFALIVAVPVVVDSSSSTTGLFSFPCYSSYILGDGTTLESHTTQTGLPLRPLRNLRLAIERDVEQTKQ